VLVGLGGGQHDVARASHGVDQRVVLARRGLLGELDVVDDGLGAVAAQAVDGLRVARARERPGLPEVVEGLVVDGHDQEPRVDTAPRRSKRWLIESCSRPGSRRANSTAPPAPMATSAATTAMTVRPETPLRARVAIRSAHPACEVALPGVEDDGAAGVHVADARRCRR
jgi:hypothetical protein